MPTITPHAAEVIVSFQFFGPDLGAFPATSPYAVLSTRKLNQLRLETNDQTADFRSGQSLIAHQRLIGSNPRLLISCNLEHPDLFLKKFRSEGPLVRVTVSVMNFTLVGSAQEERFVFAGLMKGPEIDVLDSPGSVSFEVVAYGNGLIFTASDEPKV